MSTKDTGGTAFPMQDAQAIHAFAAGKVIDIEDPEARDRVYLAARAQAIGGMTLRDYFAAKAITALAAPNPATGQYPQTLRDFASCAAQAYALADAMLEARK